MACIFNIAATSTNRAQYILEVIFNYMSTKGLIPSRDLVKYLITFRLFQLNMLFVVSLIDFTTLFSKILKIGAFYILVYSI